MPSPAQESPAFGESAVPQNAQASHPHSGVAQNPTGQWLVTDGTRWWFDTSSLALDFAYTGPVSASGGTADGNSETLQGPEDLSAWLATRLPSVSATDRDLQDALMLRGSITRLALAASAGSAPDAHDIDLLNLYAATPDIPPRLAGGTVQAGRTEPRAGQALSTIARDAVALFSGETLGRIRECDADDCALIYLDTSRAGNRRWCSMQRCGNRHKVRAHRARATATR
ncbi:putative RNA-binding Zn ribbon-like protein [Okibacterium sp. HSC-33S16]|uniref:CGNR zinc finger domain-containing protein n=1 Tax=Okibacterium sp. HSC-33S16 TaxID=2910965 RepID=UPI00209E9D5F|nr:CGNR zinc finger domain-containing protein [Okibacterium sp. HSC-33S16]MCP2029950.1 putative RNA-binding Zn ribbon-like protein [Okibacterium sp. HSC-33S16]